MSEIIGALAAPWSRYPIPMSPFRRLPYRDARIHQQTNLPWAALRGRFRRAAV